MLHYLHIVKIKDWRGFSGILRIKPRSATSGPSNIRIIFGLLDSVLPLPGNVAECGVWQGSALIPTGLYVRRRDPAKRVLGFDSFQGLDQTVSRDVALGGDDDPRKRVGGFSNTSYEAVEQRVRQFDLSATVALVRGYFKDTLPRHADSQFCFVHLDCVIYESYRQCLEFFYPRMVKGASFCWTSTGIQAGRAARRRSTNSSPASPSILSRPRATITSSTTCASSETAITPITATERLSAPESTPPAMTAARALS